MFAAVRFLTRVLELLLALPLRIGRLLTEVVAFNPRLGPLRHLATAALIYMTFAVLLVYVVAPLRGLAGQYYQGDKLRYDAERWLATAIYDVKGNFAGTFDARLDSLRDVNYTDTAIEDGDYIANPDHKSIPVRDVPESYWQCLVFHEDRHLGNILNPFGIDLAGVLKIPYSTIERSIALRRPALGFGGSTLPMQLARVIYKTPPNANESSLAKLRRKLSEWWIAPVIYRELTRGGDMTPLKQWAANHIWLAQRTGGAPLHGVEVTSRIVFGKEAKDLSTAEQFVLASAVNKPIILLEGNERLNAVRLDRWRYITEVRARICAERLIADDAEKKQVLFELVQLAAGPPDPQVKPKLQAALDQYAPTLAARAQANPVIRANALMPAARYGLREEMKQAYGFAWRDYVRGVTTTFDAAENLAFGFKINSELTKLDAKVAGKLNAGFTLDPAQAGQGRKLPNIIVAAANSKGEIIRYHETGDTASYFGSAPARDRDTGYYGPDHEARMIASTGKIIAAIAIANQMRDTPNTLYLDTSAPARGLETCDHGGSERRGRKAIVAFACSLNEPILRRTTITGQANIRRLIDAFGFTMPPANANGQGTPPSTAAVYGQISGSPQRVHNMAGAVLASLIGQGGKPLRMPTMVKAFDFTSRENAAGLARDPASPIVPSKLIRKGGHGLLRALLQAPLCYRAFGTSHGTLKSLAAWCSGRRANVRLHFAKTGTQVTADPNATVDVWIAGGLQFTNGAAYSYIVVAGTGSPSEPWGRSLHAAQVAAPLLEILLTDLEAHAKSNAQPGLLPPSPAPGSARPIGPLTAREGMDGNRLQSAFGGN